MNELLSLKKARILRYYLFDELSKENRYILENNLEKENFRVGLFKNKEKNKLYRDALIPVFDEQKRQPPICQLIFFTLLSSDLIFSTSPSNKKRDFQLISGTIKSLWEFTKELFYGINELAKNIVEHSGTHEGIITGFISKKNEFEISVFDHGVKGIMQTFLSSLLQKKSDLEFHENENFITPVQEDLRMIRDRLFDFQSFFDTKTTNILNEQTSRATAHLGILFFSKLVQENRGKLEVSSINKNNEYNLYPTDSSNLPMIGTFYKIVLPLSGGHIYKPYKRIELPQPESRENVNGTDFFKLKFVRDITEEIDDDISLCRLTLGLNTFNERLFEEFLWRNVLELKNSHFPFIERGAKIKILCLDFLMISSKIDASQFFRFLGKWELNFPDIHLVVYNIKTKLVFELKKINDFYYSKTIVDYWNDNKVTLLYSYEELSLGESKESDSKRFYFTDILWGRTEEDFNFINDRISNNFFNAISKHRFFERNSINENKISNRWKQKLTNPFFDSNGTLMPLDLLIEDSVFNKPIFNFNAETLLQNTFENNNIKIHNDFSEESIINYILNLQQYKIDNTHFRLGSKIHISDFYYAKPFFQNSFFAQKYAYLLAYNIVNTHLKSSTSNIKKLSLIGYGLYSELLVSTIKKMLKYFDKSLLVNCNTVNDSEEVKLNRPLEIIYENVIIIVPIATTFSTSMKIDRMIKTYIDVLYQKGEIDSNQINILTPNYNVLLVVDNTFINIDGEVPNGILKQYGWKNIDKENQIVKIKPYVNIDKDVNDVDQKYFLNLITKWSDIKDCNSCFPDIHKNTPCDFGRNCLECEEHCALKEISLFDTDKTSLTPELVFGYPKARQIKDSNQSIISYNTIRYGHFVRNSNHYHYYFNDYIFWRDNRKNVSKWLEETVKFEIYRDILQQQFGNIVILSPGHFSNADFVCMINEVVFANRATIIHYDPNIENTQNFNIFYGNAIDKADKILFADDVITSGATFLVANSYLKRIQKEKQEKNINYKLAYNLQEPTKGFDACIFFQNRSGFYEYEDIKRKLGSDYFHPKIFAFANMHIPYIKSLNNRCPLCDELKKYDEIYKSSNLTKIRFHFLKQKNKLLIQDIDSQRVNDEFTKFKNTDEKKRVEAIHRIYDWMSDIDLISEKQLFFQNTNYGHFESNDWVEDLINKTNSPFTESCLTLDEEIDNGCLLSETYLAILKVLTQPPFYNYKKLREKVFKWINQLLDLKIQIIHKELDDEFIFNYSSSLVGNKN